VYLTQAELVSEIFDYAKEYPEVKFEVFIDKAIKEVPNNININPISSSVFIQKMAKCSGIISTAGFESVCEAMYLGKPALMVPIKKHYEQPWMPSELEVAFTLPLSTCHCFWNTLKSRIVIITKTGSTNQKVFFCGSWVWRLKRLL
jgi:uncharacterized protein (TIGR00661 family)